MGSTASAGRCTSLKASSLVSLALSDSLPFWSFALNPCVLVGTMNPRMLAPSVSLSAVFAHTTAACAVEPLVIHIFVPFSTQLPSFSSRARVIMPAGFEP